MPIYISKLKIKSAPVNSATRQCTFSEVDRNAYRAIIDEKDCAEVPNSCEKDA